MNIPGSFRPNHSKLKRSNEKTRSSSLGVDDLVFPLAGSEVKVRRSRIKEVAKGLSEIAFSIGLTNDEEAYEETLTEDVLGVLDVLTKRKRQKK